MAKPDSALVKMREICLTLPDTAETPTWGSPHFRVAGKIFAGYGSEHGRASIGFKLEMDHADMMVQDPRFTRAPYVGHKGWISMDATNITDWNEVRLLVHESYRLIAPKRTVKRWLETQPVEHSSASHSASKGRPGSKTNRATGANSGSEANAEPARNAAASSEGTVRARRTKGRATAKATVAKAKPKATVKPKANVKPKATVKTKAKAKPVGTTARTNTAARVRAVPKRKTTRKRAAE